MINKNIITISIFTGAIALTALFLFTGPKQANKESKVPTEQIDGANIDKIKFFIETSKSMKGYVSLNKNADSINFAITDILPKILIHATSKESIKVELFKISSTIKPYQNNIRDLIQELRTGRIFQDNSSELHLMIKSILDSTYNENVSFFISDCIPYLQGVIKTPTNRNILKNYILDSFSKKGFAAIVFQYLSDFNGDYYYDFNNKNKFRGRILTNRPFYIIAFGKEENLIEVLKSDIFPESQKIELIGINNIKLKYSILPLKQLGKLLLDGEGPQIKVKQEVSVSNPIGFMLGINFSNLSSFANNFKDLKQNLTLYPDYIKSEIKLLSIDEVKQDPKYSRAGKIIEEKGLTHFIYIKLTDLPQDLKEIRIQYKKNKINWVDNCTLFNDVNIDVPDLEYKTFLLSSVIDGLRENFGKNNYIFQLPIYFKR